MNDADDEALYTVTDDNGCATDPDIFSEWKYDRINGHLTAIFDAFKFPDRSVKIFNNHELHTAMHSTH